MPRSSQYPVPRGAHCWQGGYMETCRFDQKTGEKAESGRKKEGKLEKRMGKRERSGGERWTGEKKKKGRLGNPEGRRPATRYGKHRWNYACHFPSTFARKATMFEPPQLKTQKCGKKQKTHIWAERTLVRHHKQTDLAPSQAQKATSAHHCPKIRKNTTKKLSKHNKVMSNIDQKRVQNFRKVSGSKN